MKKEAIEYIINIILRLRKKKSLDSILWLNFILLVREVGYQLSLIEIITQILKNSNLEISYPIISKLIEILSYLLFQGSDITLKILGSTLITFAVLKGIELFSLNNPKFQKRIREVEDSWARRMDKAVKQNIAVLEKGAKTKDAQINLLNKLLNQGLIEEEDVYNHIRSNDLYAIYVFANPLPIVKGYSSLRLYPKFLADELKCIRMGRISTLFITNTKRLPKDLRDTKILKEYLLKKLDKSLEKEWDAMLKWLSRKRKIELKEQYDLYKDKNYSELLGLTVTIIRGKVNEDNFGYLHHKVLTPKFYEMLNEEIDLDSIHISRQKKVKVKKFVMDSSFELLFFGETKVNLDKLKALEFRLKRKLNIEKFTDYQYKSKEDITSVLKREFDLEIAEKYADKLIKGSVKYEKALRALGISI